MENNTVMKKEEFEKEFYNILKRAVFCAEKARYESLIGKDDFREKTFKVYRRSENGDWIGEEMKWEMPS
jgi:hypothetical protein